MLSDLLPCVCLSVTFLIVKRVGTPVFLEFISLKDSMLLRMISSGRSSVRRFCVCWGAGLILDQLSPQVNRLWNPPGFPGLSFQIPIEWVFLQIASPFKIPRWISTAYKSSLKTWFWLSAWKIFPDTPYVLGFPTVFILIFHQTEVPLLMHFLLRITFLFLTQFIKTPPHSSKCSSCSIFCKKPCLRFQHGSLLSLDSRNRYGQYHMTFTSLYTSLVLMR